MVNRNRVGHKDDPFILASQAKQVFYIDDPLENGWSVVLSTEPRKMRKNDDLVKVDVLDELNTISKDLGDIDGFDTP